jgi:cytosine/adenosine deaminase-related metal-dependent hydrolase
MLAEMPGERLEDGITGYLDAMSSHGSVEHTDFREGGIEGVELLRRARSKAIAPPRSRVFGRPADLDYDSSDLEVLMGAVDGIGLSAAMDWPKEATTDVVAAAHDAGLPVALHCSESRREDLSWVLNQDPEFLVHMVFGSPDDFRDLEAARVPVVVCPRSTHRFTRVPPVVEMAKAGVDLHIGTDNAMLQGPSVLDEVAFLLSLPDVRKALDPIDVLAWALCSPKGSNTHVNIGVSAGSRDLAVLPFHGSDPISLLLEPPSQGADLVMTDGRLWRR